MQLRIAVKNFIQNTDHPNAILFRSNYQNKVASINNETWDQYWQKMTQDKVWADYIFIQVTAWFLKHDIMIITTSNTEENPVMIISGNINDESTPCPNATLTIGSKSNIHYQSLLPIEAFHLSSSSNLNQRLPEDQEQPGSSVAHNVDKLNLDATFEQEKKFFHFNTETNKFTFLITSDGLMHCYNCQKPFKLIVQHIKRSRECSKNIDIEDLKSQLAKFKQSTGAQRIAKLRKVQISKDPTGYKTAEAQRIAKIREIQAEKDPEGYKISESKRIAKIRETKAEKDSEGLKASEAKKKAKSRQIKAEKDPEGYKIAEAQRIAQMREIQAEKDSEGLKASEAKRKAGSRLNIKRKQEASQLELIKMKIPKIKNPMTSKDRLLKFREATLFNAIFICTCCHQRCFRTNITELTKQLRETINSKKEGLLQHCIEPPGKITIIHSSPFNGRKIEFICLTCKKHMINKRMPPMSAMNRLQLTPIRDPLLHLTELEGALIAKHLVFEKIIQLPKSRWTALKDKIVNIPIKDDDILNTIEQMPRMPKEAGLIGVELKRKKEYKNTHKQQLINPEKLYKMLDTLKRAGNPYYQFYDDYNTFKEKCQANDPEGHDIIFKSSESAHDDLHEDLHPAEYCNLQDNIIEEPNININSDDSEDQEEKDENDYITKDAVKKWQFNYNKSLCLSNKYPEISSDCNNDIPIITVAPGEGKTPSNIMTEKDWDIKAFPHIHNPDGKNGKDQVREVRITDQYYFIQRICNEDSRFAKSPAYMYAAIAFLEKKQLQRNINISYTHGKEVKTSEGETELHLDDGYAVLDDISGTPRYWKKYKYEFLAKLDNLGPFQFFFTLSCADMRWHENFAAILREKGYTVHYSIIPEGETFKTIIEVDTQEGKKCLSDFLKEDVDSSLHEFIRNNVLLATRFFQHRIQAFIREVMLGSNNPMNIKY